MARTCRFTFLVDHDEREMISQIAVKLQRTPSDALRQLVHQAAHELDVKRSASETPQHSQAHDLNN